MLLDLLTCGLSTNMFKKLLVCDLVQRITSIALTIKFRTEVWYHYKLVREGNRNKSLCGALMQMCYFPHLTFYYFNKLCVTCFLSDGGCNVIPEQPLTVWVCGEFDVAVLAKPLNHLSRHTVQ